MQARPAACDSDSVASVTNGALQLAWCDAAGDAIWMGGRGFGVFVGKDAILVNLQVAVLEDALRTRLRPGTVRGSTGSLDPSLWIISIEGFAAAAAMTSSGGRASKECREVGGGSWGWC